MVAKIRTYEESLKEIKDHKITLSDIQKKMNAILEKNIAYIDKCCDQIIKKRTVKDAVLISLRLTLIFLKLLQREIEKSLENYDIKNLDSKSLESFLSIEKSIRDTINSCDKLEDLFLEAAKIRTYEESLKEIKDHKITLSDFKKKMNAILEKNIAYIDKCCDQIIKKRTVRDAALISLRLTLISLDLHQRETEKSYDIKNFDSKSRESFLSMEKSIRDTINSCDKLENVFLEQEALEYLRKDQKKRRRKI